jgi:hypothetical protein
MNDISYEASLRANYEAVRERLGVPPRRFAVLALIRETVAEDLLKPGFLPNEVVPASKRTRDWLMVGPTPDIVEEPPLPENMPQRMLIVLEVAREHGFTLAEMRSTRRGKKLVWARYKAMWRLKRETPLSYVQIGMLLGGRDPTTVLYGLRVYEAWLAGALA